MKITDHYLPSLDGWRAIAIILVMLSHWWASDGGDVVANGLRYITNQGDLGVRIFFVISGFLITLLLLREHTQFGRISLRNFYARRILRIVPVYAAFLAVLGFLAIIGLYDDAPSSWIGSVTFTRNMLGQGRSATAHLWSLAVEEQFYLFWPITMIGLGLARRLRWAGIILTAIAILAFGARLLPCDGNSVVCERIMGVHSAIKYADCLSIGCMAAYAFTYMHDKLPHSQALLFISFSSLIFSTLLVPSTKLATSFLISIQAFLTAICLISSITSKHNIIFYLLNTGMLIRIGVLSYSLYIWHLLFLSQYMGDHVAGLMLYDWKVWPLAAAATATISYYFFERPMTKLRRHLQLPNSAAAKATATKHQPGDSA